MTTPFQFDRNIKLASLRIGVDAAAPKEFVDKLRELGATPTPLGPRPQLQGGGGRRRTRRRVGGGVRRIRADEGEGTRHRRRDDSGAGAARRRGGRRWWWRALVPRRCAAAAAGGGAAVAAVVAVAAAAGGAGGDPGNPTGMAALTRWTSGRFPRAFDFIQAQRRRYILISQMAELLKDLDMYVPGNGYDVGLHAQTGHPCAVVPYKFEPQPAGRGGGGVDGGGPPDTTAAPPPVVYNPQPICAVLAGNLYNDDKILSVAHQYQMHTEWHLKHPS